MNTKFNAAPTTEVTAHREIAGSRSYVPLRAEGPVRIGEDIFTLSFHGRRALVRVVTTPAVVQLHAQPRERGPVNWDSERREWTRRSA